MASDTIPINSGTGPRVAVDTVGTGTGTNNYQIVKIMQAATGAENVNLDAAWNVAITTGTVSILGTVAVSGGGGVQYSIADTSMAATGTGTLMLGMQSGATTARGIALTTTGGIFNVQTVATITTLLGTVAVSGGGGGVQYSVGDTSMAATGTGTLMLAMQSGATTGRSIAITTTGAVYTLFAATQAVTAANVTIASITTGTVNIAGNIATVSNILTVGTLLGTVAVSGGGGGVQYSQGDTAIGATGTGTILFGIQSTTAFAIGITASNRALVSVANVISASGVTIASVTTGTMNVINVLSASGVTIASVATGTMHVTNVLSATGVIVASLTTGTVNVVNQVAVIGTAHASRWDAYAVNTTSGASVIVKTSGAHTLYIIDLVLSVDVPSRVDIYSAATTKLSLYLATKGGFAVALTTPMVLNTAQSLTFQPSASGSSMLWAAGYTVT